MQKTLSHIIWFILLLGCISIVYFLSLLLHLPLLISIIVIVLYCVFSLRWISKYLIVEEEVPLAKRYAHMTYTIFVVGVAIMVNKLYYLEHVYGDWDAWMIWNYHAKFLQHPEYWKDVFSTSRLSHPDYPLFVSALIAFFWRMVGSNMAVVPFVISLFFTLISPVIIYLSLYRKSLIVAGIVFLLFVTDEVYLSHGISQYADVPLAGLLLCAVILIDHVGTNKYTVILIGALLGLCMWAKNEGIMLSVLFLLFYARAIFIKVHLKYFLVGIIIPLCALIIFKSMAPTNNLLGKRTTPIMDYLTDSSRYKLIASHLWFNLNANFKMLLYGLAAYILCTAVLKRWPGRNMLFLICCVAGYFMVYVLTNEDLEWHLQTSMDRLMLQLLPSFMYVVAMRVSDLKFLSMKKEIQ